MLWIGLALVTVPVAALLLGVGLILTKECGLKDTLILTGCWAAFSTVIIVGAFVIEASLT
jgi:hypothetical protein